MKTLAKVSVVLAVLLLAFIATFAFAVVGLRPDSEVTMHLFSDEQFVRARPICAAIGIVASILALSLVGWLWRAWRRSHEMA
jgi:magnesium-transporting ATPase (P-type)